MRLIGYAYGRNAGALEDISEQVGASVGAQQFQTVVGQHHTDGALHEAAEFQHGQGRYDRQVDGGHLFPGAESH